eukprot:Rmarinus@m.15534
MTEKRIRALERSISSMERTLANEASDAAKVQTMEEQIRMKNAMLSLIQDDLAKVTSERDALLSEVRCLRISHEAVTQEKEEVALENERLRAEVAKKSSTIQLLRQNINAMTNPNKSERGPRIEGEAQWLMGTCVHTISSGCWVYECAFSPSGRYLACACDDNTLRVYEATSQRWECAHVLQGHTSIVYTCAFSPDGRYLISGGQDGTCRIYETTAQDSWPCVTTLKRPGVKFNSAVFSPDGRHIATGCYDGPVCVWDAKNKTFECTMCFEDLQDAKVVVFSPDGKYLVCGSRYKVATVFETTSPGPIFTSFITLTGHQNGIACASFSPDTSYLATSSYDGTVRVWSVHDGSWNNLRILTRHAGPVHSCRFSPDGRYLVTGGMDKKIMVWAARTGTWSYLETMIGHEYTVFDLEFSPGGDFLVSGSGDQTIRVWAT